MSGNTVSLTFAGDASSLEKSFDRVGSSSRKLASEVDKQSDAHGRLGERIGSNEGKFMGTADLLDGLGGAFGLPTEGATKMFRAFGDLSGGFEIVSGIMPAISGMFPKLAGAMTFVSAHPLMMGLLAGGAIIGGLILLEKKFGLVSGAVGALGGVFRAAWENGIKPALNFMIAGVELYLRAMAMPFTLLNKIPGVGRLVPDGLANISLPRLDVGGSVLQTGVAVVHRGEFVTPAGGQGPAGGTSITVIVNGSVTSERQLVDAIHSGLLDKQRRAGNLGIRAA